MFLSTSMLNAEAFNVFPLDKTGWKIQRGSAYPYLIKECPEYFVSFLLLSGVDVKDTTFEVYIKFILKGRRPKDIRNIVTVIQTNEHLSKFNYNLDELEDWTEN